MGLGPSCYLGSSAIQFVGNRKVIINCSILLFKYERRKTYITLSIIPKSRTNVKFHNPFNANYFDDTAVAKIPLTIIKFSPVLKSREITFTPFPGIIICNVLSAATHIVSLSFPSSILHLTRTVQSRCVVVEDESDSVNNRPSLH